MQHAPAAGLDAGILVLDQLGGNHPFVDASRSSGLAVTVLPSGDKHYLAEARAVAGALDAGAWDVLHTHGYHADLVGLVAAWRAHRKVASTVHGETGGDWKNRTYEFIQRQALRRFDRVISVSAPLTERLVSSGVPRARIVTMRNAFAATPGPDRVAARTALGLPGQGFRIGWVGRLSSEKGPDIMLEALALVKGAEVRLSMVGDGPQRAPLALLADTLGIAPRVTWHGAVKDAGSLLAAFDVIVLSSRTEGTPMVLLEAMTAGVPVVATAVGGVPDVVSDAEALLVPSEWPDALAEAMRRIMSDPAAAQDRAGNARRRADESFAVGPWLARHAALYAEMLDHVPIRRMGR